MNVAAHKIDIAAAGKRFDADAAQVPPVRGEIAVGKTRWPPGRIRAVTNGLGSTYMAPLAAVDPAMARVAGRCKPA